MSSAQQRLAIEIHHSRYSRIYFRHCINYAPKFIALAKGVTEKYPQVEFYGVSCKAHRDVCADYTIRGYPTVHAWKANSDTSEILGKARTSETKLIELLELDKILVEEERKLVDEDDESEEDDTQTKDDEDVDAVDGEDKDSQEDSEAEDTEDDEEDGTGKAKFRVGGRASNAAKASAKESDENASEGNADEADETVTEGDGKEADSNEEDVEESDGDTNAEDAPIQMIPPADGKETAKQVMKTIRTKRWSI